MPICASSASRAGRGAGEDEPGHVEAVGDPPLGQIVGRHFDEHLVAREDADAVLAHLARRVGDDFVFVLELYAECCIRQQFRHNARKLEQFFLRHSLSFGNLAGRMVTKPPEIKSPAPEFARGPGSRH